MITVISGISMMSAGCLDITGEATTPTEIIEQFFAAIDDGDAEAANELIHPDSPEGELSQKELVDVVAIDYAVGEAETIEESDEMAAVQFELLIAATNPITDETVESTNEMTIELRRHDGEWQMYDVPEGDVADEIVEESLVPDTSTIPEAVDYVNEMIEEINTNEDSSLQTFNDLTEGTASVPPIEPVEASSRAEALEEAERLREDEPERLEEQVLVSVATKVHQETERSEFDPEEITSVEEAEELAESVEEHNVVAADNILLAVDFVDFLSQILDLAANVLENAEKET